MSNSAGRKILYFYIREDDQDFRPDHALWARFDNDGESSARALRPGEEHRADLLVVEPEQYELSEAYQTQLDSVLRSDFVVGLSDAKKEAVATTMRRLAEEGFKVFIVGGAVRDVLLDPGATPNDLDLVGDAPFNIVSDEFANQMRERMRDARYDPPSENAVLILTEIPGRPDPLCEYAMCKHGAGGVQRNYWRLGGDYVLDHEFRDLYINCLLYDVHTRNLVDPSGGVGLHDLGFSPQPDGHVDPSHRVGPITLRPIPLPSNGPYWTAAQHLARVLKALKKYHTPEAIGRFGKPEILPTDEWLTANRDKLIKDSLPLDKRRKRALKELGIDKANDDPPWSSGDEELIREVCSRLSSDALAVIEATYEFEHASGQKVSIGEEIESEGAGQQSGRRKTLHWCEGVWGRIDDRGDRGRYMIVSLEEGGDPWKEINLCSDDRPVEVGVAGDDYAWCAVETADGDQHVHGSWEDRP